MVCDYFEQFNKHDIRKTDANNILLACGSYRILELIYRAEEIPVKNLKYLMDCEVTNVNDMERVTTGFKGIDDILYGSLFPCFTIFSGKSGEGKSSLANIISVISPIENGHKVFVFSGELDEGQLASWIMAPLAGTEYTLVWDNDGGKKGFSVERSAEEEIRKYYHDNIIMYSANEELETSGEELLNAMEVAYRKYGCDVFLIDNLMCLTFDGINNENKWDTQKKFIIKLMNFTKQYNVNTNLVLHPKKPAAGQTDAGIYDLYGASEIGNLCHRMLWIKKLESDEEGYSTEVSVIKDRPSQSAGKKCKLMYDYHTRRFYSTNSEFNKKYKWSRDFNPEYNINTKQNLMCNRKDIMNEVPKIGNFNYTDCDQI